jgi:hypothetical protein
MKTYAFHGFVAREATLRAAIGELPAPPLQTLRLGLAFLSLTDELAAALAGGGSTQPISVEVDRLTAGAAAWGAEASRRGPLVYVEGEVEAGSGWHAAVVWRDGAVVYGPFRLEDRAAVNGALRLVGVEPEAGGDELGALGLDAEPEPG